jgi:hypothetical protein
MMREIHCCTEWYVIGNKQPQRLVLVVLLYVHKARCIPANNTRYMHKPGVCCICWC